MALVAKNKYYLYETKFIYRYIKSVEYQTGLIFIVLFLPVFAVISQILDVGNVFSL